MHASAKIRAVLWAAVVSLASFPELSISGADPEWVARHQSSSGGEDHALDIAVDSRNHVIVAVSSSPESVYRGQLHVVKLDGDGEELWRSGLDSSEEFRVPSGQISVGTSGRIYVLYVLNDGARRSQLTILSPDGGVVQSLVLEGVLTRSSLRRVLAVDRSEHVHALLDCGSFPNVTRRRVSLLSFDTDGNLLLEQRQIDGHYHSSLAIDGAGNVYVSGDSLLKYSPQGTELWIRAVGSRSPAQLTVDSLGNAFVIEVHRDLAGRFEWAGSDMVRYDSEGTELWRESVPRTSSEHILLAAHGEGGVYAAHDEVFRYDATGALEWNVQGSASALVVASNGGVFVGRSRAATIRYSSAGDELWRVDYSRPTTSDCMPLAALVTDVDGNVYAASTSYRCSSFLSGPCRKGDVVVAKHDDNGREVWTRVLDSPGIRTEPTDLVIDEDGQIWVAARDHSGSSLAVTYAPAGAAMHVLIPEPLTRPCDDFFEYPCESPTSVVRTEGGVYLTGCSGTMKYTGVGEIEWAVPIQGTSAAAGPAGSLYIGSGSLSRYSPAGEELWQADTGVAGSDWVSGLDVDGNDNAVAIVSRSHTAHRLFKLSPEGASLLPSPLELPELTSPRLTVGAVGAIVVAGKDGDAAVTLLNFDGADGRERWRRKGPITEAFGVAIAPQGRVLLVTARELRSYDPSGELEWIGRLPLAASNEMILTLHDDGRPVVVARSDTHSFFIAEYSSAGSLLWDDVFQSKFDDVRPGAVALGEAGAVWVSASQGSEIVTIKYGGHPVFRRGDCNDDGAVDISDAVFTLGSLFLGESDPGCDDGCDSNDDGTVDISDAIATLGVLFLGNGVIPLPGMENCGVDPTQDEVGCEAASQCQ